MILKRQDLENGEELAVTWPRNIFAFGWCQGEKPGLSKQNQGLKCSKARLQAAAPESYED